MFKIIAGNFEESKLRAMLTATDQGRIVVGVDEAGYGPNLGPLVIAATAWHVPSAFCEQSFIDLRKSHFLPLTWSEGCQHVPLGDSKQLYSPAVGLRTLEAGLLALLAQIQQVRERPMMTFRGVLERIALTSAGSWGPGENAWYQRLPETLPLIHSSEEIDRLAGLANQRLAGLGIRLLAVRASIITESHFNQMANRLGSKGRLLATVTMDLVGELFSQSLCHLQGCSSEIFCDRQGGRKKYSCVLLEAMPEEWFDTLSETPMRSSYRRLRQPEQKFHFSVGGDSFPPTALASMTAKYIRERLMASINDYWSGHVADLKPTAGYPNDAKRFRLQIQATADRLGHDSADWWRVC